MIAKWKLKAVVQKLVSFMPYRHKINLFFQKHITKGVFLTDDYFIDRLSHAKNHIKFYKKHAKQEELGVSLELGTGWYPVVPVSLFLCGASAMYTVDITPLSNKERVITTLEKFLEFHKSGKLSEYLTFRPGRIGVLKDLVENQAVLNLDDITRRLHLKYLVQDARHLSIDNNFIDLVHSNNTFEHIYPDILEAILVEFKRIAKEGGILSHFIDMSDHFAHFDRSISIYNYLKYNDEEWKRIDNDIQPQNRYRLSEYQNLYRKLLLSIDHLEVRKGNTEILKKVKLAAKYQNFDVKDLAVSHCHVVSKM